MQRKRIRNGSYPWESLREGLSLNWEIVHQAEGLLGIWLRHIMVLHRCELTHQNTNMFFASKRRQNARNEGIVNAQRGEKGLSRDVDLGHRKYMQLSAQEKL